MLRPLPLVAVRQQQHQPAGLAPLGFGAGDELVDHDLRAVGEIAELRLPQHQRQRIGHAVAELESHHGDIRSASCRTHRSAPGSGADAASGMYVAPVSRVVETQVALAEGAAPAILAAQPHRRAFQHQAAERQRLAERPVDGPALSSASLRFSTKPCSLGCRWKFVRERGDAVAPPARASRGPRPSRAEWCAISSSGHRAQLLHLEAAPRSACAASKTS